MSFYDETMYRIFNEGETTFKVTLKFCQFQILILIVNFDYYVSSDNFIVELNINEQSYFQIKWIFANYSKIILRKY